MDITNQNLTYPCISMITPRKLSQIHINITECVYEYVFVGLFAKITFARWEHFMVANWCSGDWVLGLVRHYTCLCMKCRHSGRNLLRNRPESELTVEYALFLCLIIHS